MSRRRRGPSGPPITLFSFQDIIASVTGVVIFVTFMLLIELVMRPVSAASPAGIATASDRAERAEQRLAELPTRQRSAPVSPAELTAAREATAALAELARVLAERADRLSPEVDDAVKALDDRRREVDEARRQLADTRGEFERERARTRVTLLQGPRVGKRTWFVECDAGEVRVGEIDPDTGLTRLEKRFAAYDSALQWVLARPADQERVVLVARPTGVEAFGQLQQSLRAHGRDLGWDLWAGEAPLFTEASTDATP